jgi:hypothetical protein
MPTATTTPATTRELLDALALFGLAAEGEDLTFDDEPPAALDAVVRVLHTGVRAQLSGRRWVGCDGTTGRVTVLNPAAPVPAGVTLLCVEGDTRWDRIDPAARFESPRLFDPTPGPLARG